MKATEVINKYYLKADKLHYVLLKHSKSVANKALWIAHRHPELKLDEEYLYEGAMLHDIGIFLTAAPEICCYGPYPYICHGYKGAELLRKEGLPQFANVCERHTGAGLTKEEIIRQQLPLPHRDMVPVSMEEQVICFADKFFSKTHLDEEKTVEMARKSLMKYSMEGVKRFDRWCTLFL